MNQTVVEEDGTAKSGGMKSSVLRFKNINFVVGSGDKERHILSDVSGTVKWGHVLAVMGPSGAGKTTLINALTLDALYGKPIGEVTLNGVPMSDAIFREHCYVVKQHDKHWPYLSCRETLRFAAELYGTSTTDNRDLDAVVEDIVQKMGLSSCADTRNVQLSGGQRRRLSIGIALLKQPTLLFLDEPTSGLDAAAASSIMREIVRVAKEENLIILCTIHQPSTKVYNGFDELMILSRGRQAFSGSVTDSIPYFESIGYPCPPATNPAEFFLDLVNSDFSDEALVTEILDTWEEKKPDAAFSSHRKSSLESSDDDDGQDGVTKVQGANLSDELTTMIRRHALMMTRDPILYVGRLAVFLVSCTIFAVVYWNARKNTQDQVLNKMWASIWFVAVPSQAGSVAVYALNDEFKSVLRESKNGMVSGLSYILAKSLLVLPILFLFAVSALGIPQFVIQDGEKEAFGILIVLFACLIFVFESLAECLSVWFEDPILGMLQYMNFWFGSFLFGGFLIPLRDLYWPFTLFYYIMPFSYYVRSMFYQLISSTEFEPCLDPTQSAICTNSTSGVDVLNELNPIVPLFSSENHTTRDILILLSIGLVYKATYVVGVFYKMSRVAKFTKA